MQDFILKFEITNKVIYETEYWIWSLRPHQPTIGSGVLSLKRKCINFSDLTKEEFKDLYYIVPVIEKSLKLSFDYSEINYLMLMMVDKQIHYHVIPRYKDSINFSEHTWIDKNYPNLPNLSGEKLDDEKSFAIIKELKSHIK